MKRKRFTEEQIIDALKRVDGGLEVRELCRDIGISTQTYYTWRRKYGGMEKTEVMKLKQLKCENRQLKRLVADQALDIQALKGINEKNW